jgi:SAM-dependent methyltransferase
MTTQENIENPIDVRTYVRDRYGKIAQDFSPESVANCCGPQVSDSGCCSPETSATVISADQLYEMDVSDLPTDVTGLSLGCGDPVTLASLVPGQTVLDLGSGGGIDCFLAAKQVGETGHVIGVDMTATMIEKARANKTKMGVENVEFRLGEIEHLPVADETVDIVISNCVINLSPDKPQVFREAFRVLRPGGKLSVSDIVTDGSLPEEIKNSMSAWAGCVAGALDASEYIAAIEPAGFTDVELEPVYFDKAMFDSTVEQLDLGEGAIPSIESLEKSIYSAKVTARKPM